MNDAWFFTPASDERKRPGWRRIVAVLPLLVLATFFGASVALAAAPIAVDDELTTTENTDGFVSVLDNDSDPDGDFLSVTSNTDPANGTASCDEFGECTYTPDTGYSGPDSFDYTVSDGTETDTGTVAVTVVANTPPIAVDDELTTKQDTEGVVFVLDNDEDPDLDDLTITSNTDPGNGTATCDLFGEGFGACTYTPDSGFIGPDSFDYTVSDGTETDTGTVHVTVVANSPPVAVDDGLTLEVDTVGIVFVLDNDSDADEDDALTLISNTDPANGSATCDESGECAYTPNSGYIGPDSFDYAVSDGTDTDTGTVDVNVVVAGSPIAVNDELTVKVDTAGVVFVLNNDSDSDGDTLALTANTDPANGSATCDEFGECTYIPDSGYIGPDGFDYTVSDGTEADTGTVHVTVVANSPPVAVDDHVTVDANTVSVIEVLGNDDDPDFQFGDELSVTDNTDPIHGAAACDEFGACAYTPDADYVGPDSFDYTVTDGVDTDTGTVVITVRPNLPESVTNDDAGAAALAAAIAADPSTVTGAGFDAVPTSGTPNAVVPGALGGFPTDGSSFALITSGNANLADDPNDSPGSGVNLGGSSVRGDSDFDVTVLAIDLAVPSTANCLTIDFRFLSEEYPEFVGSAFNDAFIAELDVSDWTTAGSSITAPHNFAFDQNGDVVSINSSGVAAMTSGEAAGTTYDGATPRLSASVQVSAGAHTLYLSIFDQGDHILDSATFLDNLLLGFVPDPETQCAPGAVLRNFDLTISPESATNPVGSEHTLAATLTETVSGAPVGDEEISFTVEGPNATTASATTNQDGEASFTYLGSTAGEDTITACFDANESGVCDTGDAIAVATKTWEGVGNDPPDAVDDALTTAEDTPGSVNVLANDTDPDGDALSVTGNSQGANGTVSCEADGDCTYTPNAGFNGTDSFTYTISDGNGGTDTATVNVTVEAAANLDPDAVDDALTTAEDTPGTVNVLANDTDPDGDALSVTGNSQGANGTVSCEADGDCTYTPAPDFNGSDAFTYDISDGNGGTDTATVNVTVTPVNDPPNAVDDTLTTQEDTPGAVNVLANDTDPDGDALTVTGNSQGANGTVSCEADGDCTYTPAPDFNGSDAFTYTISDGNGGTDTAMVNVTVTPVNDLPNAVDDTLATQEDTPGTVNVLTNDTDPDGDTLSVTGNTQGANGTVSCEADGDCTYTPNAGFSGTDSFTYTISDGNGGTDTATVNVTVEDEAEVTEVEIKVSPWRLISLTHTKSIKVVLFSTPGFDATTVDLETICFGDAEEPSERSCEPLRPALADVDRDGDLDLVVHFKTDGTGIDAGDTEVCLHGMTLDGTPIEGCTEVLRVEP